MISVYREFLAQRKDEMIRHIQNLVRIESVEGLPQPGQPFGRGPAQALAYVLQLGKDLGFRIENLDNYAGWLETGAGERTVAVLTHVDTVPAGKGWTVDPFCGELRDGRIYGRGSYDDKGPAIASIYALLALEHIGWQPKKRARLIFGTNEETGMQDLVYYLQHQPQPDQAFSPDAPFPVVYGEKGVLEQEIFCPVGSGTQLLEISCDGGWKMIPGQAGAVLHWPVGMGPQFPADREALGFSISREGDNLLLTVTGKGAPAAYPQQGCNAAAALLRWLAAFPGLEQPIQRQLTQAVQYLGRDERGQAWGCAMADEISTPLTMALVGMELREQCLVLRIHIRYPVQGNAESIFAANSRVMAATGWEVKVTRHSPAHYVPADSPLVRALMEVYRQATGDVAAQPVTMTGGTYARALRNAVAFGPLFPGEAQLAHEPDESVSVESLLRAADLYAQALYRLCCDEEDLWRSNP